jgi:hypothetical protein
MLIKDYTVFNPNFISDVIAFLGLSLPEDQVRRHIADAAAKHPLTQEGKQAGKLSIEEKLNAFIDRIEFIGHLRLLSLHARKSGFEILGQEVVGVSEDIAALRLYLALTCIDMFHQSDNHKAHFRSVFEQAPEGIARQLQSNLRVVSSARSTNDLKEIADYLYNIRNYYTHTGKRFHVLADIPFAQIQDFPVGTLRNKEEKSLVVAREFDYSRR